MARHHRWPTHARSGQGDPARTVRAPPRPGIRAAPFSSHQVPDRRPKSACRARTASPKSQCGTRARPAQSTNPHSPSRAARGFLHVRISYAKSARNPSTLLSFPAFGLAPETGRSFTRRIVAPPGPLADRLVLAGALLKRTRRPTIQTSVASACSSASSLRIGPSLPVFQPPFWVDWVAKSSMLA